MAKPKIKEDMSFFGIGLNAKRDDFEIAFQFEILRWIDLCQKETVSYINKKICEIIARKDRILNYFRKREIYNWCMTDKNEKSPRFIHRSIGIKLSPLNLLSSDFSISEGADAIKIEYNNTREAENTRYLNLGNAILADYSGLMWLNTDPPLCNLELAYKLIDELNRKKFMSYSNWRLPTIEELASLCGEFNWRDARDADDNFYEYCEPPFISPVFNGEKRVFWSTDLGKDYNDFFPIECWKNNFIFKEIKMTTSDSIVFNYGSSFRGEVELKNKNEMCFVRPVRSAY